MWTSRPRLTFDRVSLCAACVASFSILGALAGCDVYDSSLLVGGGHGGGVAGSPATGAGGQGQGGGRVSCETPDQCPGTNNECGTVTCENGLCGVDAAPEGTPATMQTAKDCIKMQCDGLGAIVGVEDNSDLPEDGNDCTTDTCSGGVPDNKARPLHSSCTGAAGAKVCSPDAVCVECTAPNDCPSGSCTDRFACAPASCTDGLINNGETDLNCGGPNCTACAIGKLCQMDSDCLSQSCSGLPLQCQESCTDGMVDQDETDVDCGGSNCGPCTFGQICDIGGDCDTGACSASNHCTCPANDGVLLLSEIRTRGPGMGNDDFVELYNPGTVSVTLSSSWIIQARSSSAGSYTTRFTGSGQVVGPNRHFLVGGSAYSGSAPADATLSSGITDEGSVILKNGGALVDAVCFRCGSTSLTGYTCEGSIAMKTGCTNNVDKSIERKPGGSQGNCIDTQDNLSDFVEITPSTPEDLASPPVP